MLPEQKPEQTVNVKELMEELKQVGVMLNWVRAEGTIIIAMTFKLHVEILRTYAYIHWCKPMANYDLAKLKLKGQVNNYAMNKYACEVAFTMKDPLDAVPLPDPGYELSNLTYQIPTELDDAQSPDSPE